MSSRGYSLIDVPVDGRLWPDMDLIVAVMEYVRINLRAMDPGIPPQCEFDLIAGETSHNARLGPLPLLGLHVPPEVVEEVPDWQHLNRVVESWCESKSDDELRSIARATPAPTWELLLALGIHPQSRRDDGAEFAAM